MFLCLSSVFHFLILWDDKNGSSWVITLKRSSGSYYKKTMSSKTLKGCYICPVLGNKKTNIIIHLCKVEQDKRCFCSQLEYTWNKWLDCNYGTWWREFTPGEDDRLKAVAFKVCPTVREQVPTKTPWASICKCCPLFWTAFGFYLDLSSAFILFYNVELLFEFVCGPPLEPHSIEILPASDQTNEIRLWYSSDTDHLWF